MVIYQSVQKGWPDQTPPYPRRFMGAEESGRSPGSWSMRSAPSHTFVCTVDLQTATIYSGGTALEFHQLPY